MKNISLIAILFISVFYNTIYAQNKFRQNYQYPSLLNMGIPGNIIEGITNQTYILAGTNTDPLPSGTVAKLDNEGEPLWTYKYTRSGLPFTLQDVKKDATNNNYYLCGGDHSNYAIFMTVDDDGNIEKSTRFKIDEAAGAQFNSIMKTSDGGYIAVGTVSNFGPGSPEVQFTNQTYIDPDGVQQTETLYSPLIVKLNGDGIEEWHKVFRYYKTASTNVSQTIVNSAYFYDVVETDDGYVAVGSYKVNDYGSKTNSDGEDTTPRDALILKTSTSGDIIYHKQIDNPNTDPSQKSKSLAVANLTTTGDVIAAGLDNSNELIQKYKGTGGFSNLLSRNFEYGGGGFSLGEETIDVSDIMEDPNTHELIVMGMYVQIEIFPPSFNFTNEIHKMSADATSTIWAKTYNFGMGTILPKGEQVSDGGFIALSTSMQPTGFNYHVIKTDSQGETPDECEPETVNPSPKSGPSTFEDPYYKYWSGTPTSNEVSLNKSNVNLTADPQCIEIDDECVEPAPANTINADDICLGESTTISASGPDSDVTYFIYDAATGGTSLGEAPLEVTPTETTTYYVETVRDDDDNCVSETRPSIEVEVTVIDLPQVDGQQSFCTDATIGDLDAEADENHTIHWYASETNDTELDDTEELEDGETYYVSQSNGTCESERVEVEVSIGELEKPTLDNADFCEETTLDEVDITGNNITWYDVDGNEITNPAAENISNGDVYFATQTEGDCESEQLEVEINVGEIAKPTLDNADFCEETTLDEVNITGNNITWYDVDGNEITNPAAENISDGDVYFATQTEGDCESEQLEVEINVGEIAKPTLTNADFCEETTLDEVGITGNDITWYDVDGNEITNPAAENISEGDVYFATQTIGDCESEQTEVEISIGTLSPPTTDPHPSFCGDATIGDLEVNETSIQWYDADGNILPPSTSLQNGETYYVTHIDGDCESAKTEVTVQVESLELEINKTDVTCNGENNGSATVSVVGGAGNYEYEWTPSGGNEATANHLTAGSYFVTVSNDEGCEASISVTIGEPSPIHINGNITHIGCNQSEGAIHLTINGGTGNYTVEWSDGSSGTSLANLGAGNYSVVVTDENGCSSEKDFIVQNEGGINVHIVPNHATIYPGENVDLSVEIDNPTGNETYSWSPEEGLSCSDCPNPTANPNQTTTYTVTVTSEDGCVGEDKITINVKDECADIYIPNIFSPNNDGKNDEYRIFGQKECIKEFRLQIFDRWGELLFETNTFGKPWDGKYKGKMINSGVYVYKVYVKTIEGEVINESGNLDLVR